MRACGRWGPACPACGRETQREEAQFRCSGCGHEFQSSYWQDELRSERATEGGAHSGAEAGAESGKRVRRAPVTFLTVQSRQVLDEFVLRREAVRAAEGDSGVRRWLLDEGPAAGCSGASRRARGARAPSGQARAVPPPCAVPRPKTARADGAMLAPELLNRVPTPDDVPFGDAQRGSALDE